MKSIVKLTKIYLNILSVIAPKKAGKIAFKLFQKVRLKRIRDIEQEYYSEAKKFSIPLKKEALKCYEFGENNQKLVFLVHGWESNAGSMTLFAKVLAKNNFRVIGFDIPGHGNNIETATNLYETKEAFKKLITFINPSKPFSIVSHSFGSAVTTFITTEISYKIDKIVFLSANNELNAIFNHFQKMIGFNDKVLNQFKQIVERIMNKKVEEMVVTKLLKNNKFNHLLLIHDKYDKIIPFNDSLIIHKGIQNSTLIPFEKIGHYRMLWNKKVVEETLNFLEN